MKVAFRVDASLDMGTGHVMRCLTLAEALRVQGVECHFISRQHNGHLLDSIRQRGFVVHALPPVVSFSDIVDTDDMVVAHAAWLGCNWQIDAQDTQSILLDLKPNWLIVDHYAIDQRWEIALGNCYKRLMVIDDLADRQHICDLLMDQNLGHQTSNYIDLVPKHCQVLAGPQYALLRPEFRNLREYSLSRRQTQLEFKHLLITMGGVDQPNATGQVLKALRQCSLPSNCNITVLVGPHAPWLSNVREEVRGLPWQIDVLVNSSNVAQLMAESDLAIGAAGSTSWERCCMGLPTILIVLADNQRDASFALSQANAVKTLSFANGQIDTCMFGRLLEGLLNNRQHLLTMAQSASVITDGDGCQRVVDRLLRIKY